MCVPWLYRVRLCLCSRVCGKNIARKIHDTDRMSNFCRSESGGTFSPTHAQVQACQRNVATKSCYKSVGTSGTWWRHWFSSRVDNLNNNIEARSGCRRIESLCHFERDSKLTPPFKKTVFIVRRNGNVKRVCCDVAELLRLRITDESLRAHGKISLGCCSLQLHRCSQLRVPISCAAAIARCWYILMQLVLRLLFVAAAIAVATYCSCCPLYTVAAATRYWWRFSQRLSLEFLRKRHYSASLNRTSFSCAFLQ